MKKQVILNVTNSNMEVIQASQQHTYMQLEIAKNTEEAIEKLHLLPVETIIIDANFKEEEIQKITKIGKLLQPEIRIKTTDLANAQMYLKNLLGIRQEILKQKMDNYQFEDNPNLNNPFLNLDKTNIFNN